MTKENRESHQKRNLLEDNGLNCSRFLIRCHGNQNKMIQHFNVLKKTCQPRILCPTKVSLKNKGEITTFLYEEKSKGLFFSRRLSLKELGKEVFPTDGKFTRELEISRGIKVL